MEAPLARQGLDLTGKSLDELDAIEEAVQQAKEKKAVEQQNDLIRQYQELRMKMIRRGISRDDQLPNLKIRGWTRKKAE